MASRTATKKKRKMKGIVETCTAEKHSNCTSDDGKWTRVGKLLVCTNIIALLVGCIAAVWPSNSESHVASDKLIQQTEKSAKQTDRKSSKNPPFRGITPPVA